MLVILFIQNVEEGESEVAYQECKPSISNYVWKFKDHPGNFERPYFKMKRK